MNKKSQKSLIVGVAALIVVIIVVVVVILLVSNKNSSGSLSAAQQSADKAQIETNWKKFFAAATPLSEREKLLQNGSQFAVAMQGEFSSLGSAASSAVISSVTLTNSTSAKVMYSVDLGGQPVLSNQSGKALLINNNWVVSGSTLCQLLTLGGSKPSICQQYN